MKYTQEDELRQTCDFSPGPVKHHEELLRIVFNPEHISDNGVVSNAAISTSDLIENGVSANRRDYAKKEIIQRTIEHQKKNFPDNRKNVGIAILPCLVVRGFVDNDKESSFIVIDEAAEDNIAHASIYSAKNRTKGQLRKLRMQLFPLLQKRYSLQEIFSL